MTEGTDAATRARRRLSSVQWFDPLQLWRTAKKKNASTLISQHADHREIQAGFANIYNAPGNPSYHDFSNSQTPFSFDFAADTGDGWPATYAVAEVMLRPSVNLHGGLDRPGVAIFGGDLVYPTASRRNYKDRFIGPFAAAAARHGSHTPQPEDDIAAKSPRVFAIPGNHDWYDGLTAFWSLFCRGRLVPGAPNKHESGRWVGPWAARQQRSYFALKLPHDWWVWGIDIQLAEWPDTPQRDYFEDLAKHHMGARARLIICTAEPSWVHGQVDGFEHFRSLAYMANRAMRYGVQVRAVLTGDLHHYSRYRGQWQVVEGPRKEPAWACDCEFITAGGGGAFTASTHALPQEIDLAISEDGVHPFHYAQLRSAQLAAPTYPDKAASKRDARSVVSRFGIDNPAFAWFAALVWLALWPLMANWDGRGWIAVLVLWLVAGCFVAQLGKRAYTEEPWAHLGWVGYGAVHGALQAAGGWFVFLWSTALWALPWPTRYLAPVAFAIVAAVLTCVVMGLYLCASTLFLDMHHNEASSALRSTKWKNFLRVVVGTDGHVRVHAIGIDALPPDGGDATPRAIEDPIVI